MSPEIQPIFKFNRFQILKLVFSNDHCQENGDTTDLSFEMSFSPTIFKNKVTGEINNKAFCIIFKIKFSGDSNPFSLEIEAAAVFDANFDVDEKFLLSDFAKVNSPAIAFPFLRAFISNFTLNAGYPPVVLPSFNFTAVKEVEK